MVFSSNVGAISHHNINNLGVLAPWRLGRTVAGRWRSVVGFDPRALVRPVLLRATNPRLLSARKGAPRGGEIKRIVVVRPDHLGDLLFATPALQRIREAFPRAHIAGLVGPWGRAAWEGNPNLDEIRAVRFPGIISRGEGGLLGAYLLLRREAARLRSEREPFDLGVMLRYDHWWGAALLAAAGVPRRWGYSTPGVAGLLTNSIPYTGGRHEVEQNLAVAEALARTFAAGLPPVRVSRAEDEPPLLPPGAVAPADTSLLEGWLRAERRAVIHPGTASANKLWMLDGWAEIAGRLVRDGWSVALTGSPSERPLCEAIEARVPEETGDALANVAGKTAGLPELVWVLERAGVVLGVDSGPLHLADALHRPALHLYGPSDEAIWGPWGNPATQRAFRAPGTRPTMLLDPTSTALEGGPEMRAITVEMVWEEVGKLAR